MSTIDLSLLLPTVGAIAKRLGQPVSRISYLIRSRDLKPTNWAGHAQVFSEADVQFIASEIRRIDTAKGKAGALP